MSIDLLGLQLRLAMERQRLPSCSCLAHFDPGETDGQG